MRFKWLSGHWLAVFAGLTITLYSLWLALHGKLSLYVHPRYIVFTVIMSVLALAFMIADALLRTKTPRALRRTGVWQIAAGLLSMGVCAGLLLVPPAGLTSSAAKQRGINVGALGLSGQAPLTDLTGANARYEQFSIKEWAVLLAQSDDPGLFSGKPADITGFVSPAPDNNPNVFYVARFVITCCAIDARPLGVPVYQPDWRNQYTADQWLHVQGAFGANPAAGAFPIVLEPKTVTPVSQPDDPYIY